MFAATMPPTRLSLATIRPLRCELAGRCLSRYARSHSCRPATFSRPTCLAPSRLFASVPPCSVSKSVANPLSDKDSRPAASVAFFMGNRRYHEYSRAPRTDVCVSQIARAVQIAGDVWNGVTSAGVTAESIVAVGPSRRDGELHDYLTLGADDILRLA